MEKYRVLEPVGQGSYGTVFKAIANNTNQVVALKVITKRKKTSKDIQNLRKEFEIQQTLCHPNIIRMLDSFETEEDIMVVTEFAPQDLSQILRDKGHLPEDTVRDIVCDLLSALYYLHYHRVLHRDLKPQNILIEADGKAKLCDFGFARSMSIDTYVLTSIKGTPLYMAPEIIEHCPYDHSADLWSLGCIVYECLVGTPPYFTNALLRLVNLIQEEIKWPKSVSPNCLSFLHGLLQKDPSRRLSWPDLLHHPFVDPSKINLANVPSNAAVVVPLTHPLTASQALAREKQKKDLICHVAGKPRKFAESAKFLEQQENKQKVLEELQYRQRSRTGQGAGPQLHLDKSISPPVGRNFNHTNGNDLSIATLSPGSRNKEANLVPQPETIEMKTCTPLVATNFLLCKRKVSKSEAGVQTCDPRGGQSELLPTYKPSILNNTESGKLSGNIRPLSPNCNQTQSSASQEESSRPKDENKACKTGGQSLLSWISEDNPQPIECDEWLVFLQKTMEEVMEGEIEVMKQENFVAMLVGPLRNPHASSKVIEYVACLLSLPFVVNGVTEESLNRIKEVYLVVKAVPNLVYASNLLTQQKCSDSESDVKDAHSLRPISDLGADELHAMQCIYLLLCHLTHMCDDFLVQFCDAVAILIDGIALLQQLLLLGRRKLRIVADLLAILAHILRVLPENAILVEQILLGFVQGGKSIDLSRFLTHSCPLIRSRCCHLLRLLGRCSCRALQSAWSVQLRSDLERLLEDSTDVVREAAEEAVSKLKGLVFYEAQSRPKR